MPHSLLSTTYYLPPTAFHIPLLLLLLRLLQLLLLLLPTYLPTYLELKPGRNESDGLQEAF